MVGKAEGLGAMNEFEANAFRAWIANGTGMVEQVALIVDGTWWYALENVAEQNPDGRGEFFVEGETILQVMNVILMEHGEERTRVLWHTHVNTIEPSQEDIDEFPEWLADAGAIYHVPTGTTTLYNQSGIISPVNSVETGTLATSED